MIRPAVLEDMPELLRMARDFYEASGLGRESPYDGPRMAEILRFLIESEDSTVIVSELRSELSGMVAVVKSPDMWAGGIVAQEVFWWIDPRHRGRRVGRKLLKAAEAWAKESGADTMVMVALKATSPNALHSVYSRAGYEPVETHYRKAL